MNKVIIAGRLVKDPEMMSSKDGLIIAKMSIAFDRIVKGEKVSNFIDAVAFGRTAEQCKNFYKGKPLIFDAELTQEQWEDSQGNRRQIHKLIIQRFSYMMTDNKQVPEMRNEDVVF